MTVGGGRRSRPLLLLRRRIRLAGAVLVAVAERRRRRIGQVVAVGFVPFPDAGLGFGLPLRDAGGFACWALPSAMPSALARASACSFSYRLRRLVRII